ncbi:MAG: DUF2262 domain-containing protein [Lachnospiraceae bacterium]|nr:DUF2262 domain-containing protein [Lachnospiraceae bacterium]
MKMSEEKKFIRDNTVTKEEFLAQFEDKTTEITVLIRSAWKKGARPFPLFGKEALANIDYMVPWIKDAEGPLGSFGSVYWFTKKSIFGYPYKPVFKEGFIYRLRVRPGRFSDRPKFRYFFLEEILEEDVDLSKDDGIYHNALDDYYMDCEDRAREMRVYVTRDLDVSKAVQKAQFHIARAVTGISAIRFMESGNGQMIEGLLEIPYDNREHDGNRNLKLKGGKIYQITARRRTGRDRENAFILQQILEENVEDEELIKLAEEARTPGSWHVDGLDDFYVKNGEAQGNILWDESDEISEVEVVLICDVDNPKTAVGATPHLLKILADKEAFKTKLFDAVVDHMADENGMIDTWEGESEGDVSLTTEEFVKRLSIDVILINPDGTGYVEVGLDEMFTDHCLEVNFNADGSFEVQGLMG